MRHGVLASLILSVGAPLYADWDEYKSRHFIVRHRGDKVFARDVARQAEGYYKRILKDIGYTRHGDYWLWDRRVKIVVYPSRKGFADSTGAPDWAGGRASHARREIATYRDSRNFLGALLPHELTHMVFIEFVGFGSQAPLWLHEGVAQWEEDDTRKALDLQLAKLAERRQLLSLTALTAMDVRTVKSRGLAEVFYAQAASLVGFLINEYGASRFGKFCRALRDGKAFDEALRFIYSRQFRNIEQLEARWLEYIAKTSDREKGERK